VTEAAEAGFEIKLLSRRLSLAETARPVKTGRFDAL
jgi:hypothetical protein